MAKKDEKLESRGANPPDTTFMLPQPGGFRDMTKSEREAEQRGYDAALSTGSVMVNPENEGTDEALAWTKGYQRGLTSLNAGVVAEPEKARKAK